MRVGRGGSILLAMAISAQCQHIEVGRHDQNYCEKIKLAPNLTVAQNAQISGRLIDASGAPFRNSTIELRLYISATRQTTVRKIKTDEDGRFNIGSVRAGKYRLIASPTRAFRQPPDLRCADERCELNITLQVNPTDQPDSQCPVR